ncbi:hypothetical protein JCM19232_3717 [Vibrio ishigakensis]|uniref:Uncharacterized protein n=1 Tax=Vibrio ishigakensis TaxID=1481914 RepID=A0A0B8P1W6_9VIBR|nr:hypothetical protein JCM19232_3717 [Vibrio ishigakensis]
MKIKRNELALYIVGLEDRMELSQPVIQLPRSLVVLEFLGMSFHRKGVRAAFINPELSVDEMQFACKT